MIKEKIEPRCDTYGGIIETQVKVEPPPWEEVRAAIYSASGDVTTFVQFRKYFLVEEADI